MAGPTLADRRGPEPFAGHVPNVYRVSLPLVVLESLTSPTVIGSALRVAAPRSLLGIVDQV
jgi:hypothetical protein